jgi:anaerobic selenocysteine-containing dehydrogenase
LSQDIRRGWCGPCHDRCGLRIHLENGIAKKVTGDPEHPSRGFLCDRGALILEHLYHPDRLNFPLKRVGERGEGKWERISWDQALDEIAENLKEIKKKHGPEALANSSGTDRTYRLDMVRFFNLYGSPNRCGAQQICWCPSETVEVSIWGSMTFSDIFNASCIVLWGFGPGESKPIDWSTLLMAKKRGTKFIVVDPRFTKDARIADVWLQVKPGTDLALMLGWINVIINENLYDKNFVDKWTVGFDKLEEHVREYTPEKVAKITGIPKEKIVEAVRLYAATKPAVIVGRYGIDKHGLNSAQAIRAKCIIRAIMGNIDIKGGECLGLNGDVGKYISDEEMELNHLLSEEQRKKQLGSDMFKLMSYPGWELMFKEVSKVPKSYMKPLEANKTSSAHARFVWDAILTSKPYPIKALIVQANNPLLQAANTRLVYDALKSQNLELSVVMDYYMTPTAQLADYVLPAACTLERDDIQMRGRVVACPKAIEPLYERKDDYFLWRELGLRLGQEKYWPWKTVRESLDYRLEGFGINFEQLAADYGIFPEPEYRKYEKYGFGTRSGKVELYSSIFEDLGYDPLPVYKQNPFESEFSKDYPLILVTGTRFMPMYNSEMRQLPSARKKCQDPVVEVHPDTARQYGISEGDWIWIENFQGKIKQKAKLTNDVHPSTIYVQHGWWFPEKKGDTLGGFLESNSNLLCPDDPKYCSPEIGSWPHSALVCKIYK